MARKPINFKTLLRQINAIRVACQIGDSLHEMPQGVIGNETQCPIARALSNGLHVEVSSTIEIEVKRGQDASRYDFQEIKRVLRAAGFIGFEIYTRNKRDENGDYVYGENGELVDDDEEYGISFHASKTMDNFIQRFDAGEFKNLIEGYDPNEDDDEL